MGYASVYTLATLVGGILAGIIARIHNHSMTIAKEQAELLSDPKEREKFYSEEQSAEDFFTCVSKPKPPANQEERKSSSKTKEQIIKEAKD